MTLHATAAAAFRDEWGIQPEVVVSAPGRINLIGEHTDYSLLPVLPMAIDRRVAVAAATSEGSRIEAVSSGRERTSFATGADPMSISGWARYLAAAAREAPGGGMRLAIASDLPSSGGLSSSSALTVAVILAMYRARGAEPNDLVSSAVGAERRVGVEGGAMDQTVAVHARRGTALRIDFAPPGLRHVPVPSELVFVAASSGDVAPKGTLARDGYNERVVASRAGAVLLAAALGVESSSTPVLADVIGHPDLPSALDELADHASARAVATRSGIDSRRIAGLTIGAFDADRPLPIAAVCRHILSEAVRVDHFERALSTGDIGSIGALLDESHRSLRRFGVSTPGLDQLTVAMRDAGALGARLTGAGFGGYALAACRPDKSQVVIDAARQARGGPAFEAVPSGGIE